jgi:deoxyadenosine/deoxycytidine kinase
MIYWINGPYGVGKSTVAEILQKKLPKAHIYDAEEVGNAIRDNFPEESKYSVIFEGYSLWRETNYKLLKEICEKYDGDIIVPMALTLTASYEEIIKRLKDSEIKVKYVILDADHMTIHDRIIARGEKEGCWCMQNIDMCLEALQIDRHAVHIDTRDKSPEQIAEKILAE